MRAIVVLAFVSCALIACAHGLPQHRPIPSPEGNPGFPGQRQHLRPSPLGKPDSNNPQLRLRPSPAIKLGSQQHQQPPLKVPQENGQHSSPSADKSPQPPFEGHLRPTPIKKHPMQSPKILPSSFPGRQEHPSFPTRSPRSLRPHQSPFPGKLRPSPFMQKPRPSPLHHEGDFVVRPTPPPMRPPRPTRSTPSFPKRLLPSRGMPRPSQFPGQILSPHASPALRPPHPPQHQQAGPVRPSMLHHKQAGPAIRPTPPLMKPFDQPTGRTHAN